MGGHNTIKLLSASADALFVDRGLSFALLETSGADTIVGLVRNFDRDRAGTLSKLQNWLAADPDGFYRGAITALRIGKDSCGLQCIVSLLIRGKMLEQILTEENLSLQEAVRIARLAMEIDQHMEVRLARRLAESVADGYPAGKLGHAPRLMSILDKISDGSGILPSLARVLRNPDPYLRSKAVLMLARGNRSAHWVQSKLLDPDPRIRANAIEALWGVEGNAARELLFSAAGDANNRVAGNALLGLYRLGDCRALAEALKMAGHTSTAFRATAAWLMGETGDERFHAPLTRLRRDPVAAVRSRALKATSRLSTALAKASQARALRVAGLFMETAAGPQKGSRKLLVSVIPRDGKGHIRPLPTQFHLSEDGCPILSYSVAERLVPEAVSLTFVFPRDGSCLESPWVTAALNCLNFKPASDLWACLQWASPANGSGTSPGIECENTLAFSADASLLASSLATPAATGECPNLWRAMWRAVRAAPQAAETRRVIVVCDETVSGGAGYELVEALSAAHDMVRVISRVPNPALEALCRTAEISLALAETAEAITSTIERECVGLLAHYEISYQAVSREAKQLEVRVQSPEGCGALTLRSGPSPG